MMHCVRIFRSLYRNLIVYYLHVQLRFDMKIIPKSSISGNLHALSVFFVFMKQSLIIENFFDYVRGFLGQRWGAGGRRAIRFPSTGLDNTSLT